MAASSKQLPVLWFEADSRGFGTFLCAGSTVPPNAGCHAYLSAHKTQLLTSPISSQLSVDLQGGETGARTPWTGSQPQIQRYPSCGPHHPSSRTLNTSPYNAYHEITFALSGFHQRERERETTRSARVNLGTLDHKSTGCNSSEFE